MEEMSPFYTRVHVHTHTCNLTFYTLIWHSWEMISVCWKESLAKTALCPELGVPSAAAKWGLQGRKVQAFVSQEEQVLFGSQCCWCKQAAMTEWDETPLGTGQWKHGLGKGCCCQMLASVLGLCVQISGPYQRKAGREHQHSITLMSFPKRFA